MALASIAPTMPKKLSSQQTAESQLVAWYKWEFLRRNAEYGQDYEGFTKEFGSWFRKHGYWYDPTRRYDKKAFNFFAKVVAPKAKAICERWQIRDPFSPEWDFDKETGSRRFKLHWEISLPTDCSSDDAGALWDLSDFLLTEEEFLKSLPRSTKQKSGPRPDHELTLAFDLRQPLKRLLDEAEDITRTRKAVYDRMHPVLPRKAASVRRRLDLYDTYLKVWDLRQSGNTFKAIANAVFPYADATQRALDTYHRADELVKGGYKELR